MNNKYDLTITDAEGTTKGFVEYFGGEEKPSVTSTPIDAPSVNTTNPTQSGGPYDVTAAGDYKRLAFRSFHSGAGQESYDTEDASPSRFLSSINVDPTEKGVLKLGPSVTSYETSPTTIQGVTAAGLGKVWQSFDPAGADPRAQLKHSTDNVTWTAVTYTGTDPTGNVTALACDGEYMYAAFSGTNGVWRGKATGDWSEYANVADDDGNGIVALACCGGYVYGAKGSSSAASSAGYFALADGQYTTLSSSGVVGQVDTVALVSVGPFVYWVTYGGSVTRVYAMQQDDSDPVFQQAAEFPRGFVGKCAFAYLGSVYVGGYYDSYTTDRGIGAIYLLAGSDASLLTTIGKDPTEDWRVLFMSGYEKHLYFVANGSIYRWSLEHGGYSHVCAVEGGETPESTVSWDVTEAMTAVPSAGWTVTSSGGTVAVTSAAGETAWSQATTTATIYAETTDGYIESSDGTYAKARAGTGSGIREYTSLDYIMCGQILYPSVGYLCYEAFLGFDTSSIPAGAEIVSATLYLKTEFDASDTDFNIQVKTRDWGSSLTTADFVAGASLSALTTVGTLSTASGLQPAGTYNPIPLSTSAVTAGGDTRFLLCSDRQANNNTPTGDEQVYFSSADKGTIYRPYLSVTYIEPGTKTYTLTGHAPVMATGTTTEVTLGASNIGAVSGTDPAYVLNIYNYDGTYLSRCYLYLKLTGSTTYGYFVIIDSGGGAVTSASYTEAQLVGGVVRFTTKNGSQNLYLNDTRILGPIPAKTDATAASFAFVVGSTNNTNNWSLNLDQLRYTNDGAYDPTVGVSTSSGAMACLRDSVWVSATDTGIYMTDPTTEATSGSLTTSRAASLMQTIPKFYRAIQVMTDQPLSGDQTLTVEWALDGQWGGGTTLTATTSTTAVHTWNINESAHDIKVKFTLARTNSNGPRVTGAAVKYLLPNQKVHTAYLHCVDGVMMRNKQRWDENASDAITWLFGLTDEYVTVATDYDSSIEAKVEDVQLYRVDRRPTRNSTYQGVVRVAMREMA